MEVNNNPHDGVIDGDSEMPSVLGAYVDFTGFWFDDYVCTIDHVIYEGYEDRRPYVEVKINGQDEHSFFTGVEVGSQSDTSIGYNPKYDACREDYAARQARNDCDV